MTSELGSIGQYYYWSNRLTTRIAEDNAIDLHRRPWSWTFAPFKFVQGSRSNARQTLFRDEIAYKIRKAIGQCAVEDFVTPPPAQFACGTGYVHMGRFISWHDKRDAAYLYTRVIASAGDKVDVCLFGSMHNFLDRIQKADSPDEGWVTSSAPWLQELLDSHGKANTWSDDPNDYEPIAVEALKIVQYQGVTTHNHIHRDLPQTRIHE